MFNVMLARHLGFKNERGFAVILLALQPRVVLQVPEAMVVFHTNSNEFSSSPL